MPDKVNSHCKGPVAGTCLKCLIKEVGVNERMKKKKMKSGRLMVCVCVDM